MKWILLGNLLGSLIVSEHDTKEACLGRSEVLKEQKVISKCVEGPNSHSLYSTGSISLCPSSGCNPTWQK